MDFGKRLKELRQQKGVTQADLAKYLDVGATAISNYEANRNEPTLDKLIQLADFFQVSCDYLLGSVGTFFPVLEGNLDRDLFEIITLYQQMDSKNTSELITFSRYLIYKQNHKNTDIDV